MPGYNSSQRRRMAEGKCVWCESPHAPGIKSCAPCAAKARDVSRQRSAQRIASGLCQCGAPAEGEGYRSCLKCRGINRHERARRHKQRRDAGLCIVCGEPRLGNADKCRQHLLENVAVGHGLPASAWRQLGDIFDAQGGRCYYTGEPIAIGINAVVEHKKPKSRFPELANDPSNWAFTTHLTNSRKGIRTDDEFIASAVAIAKHRGGLS